MSPLRAALVVAALACAAPPASAQDAASAEERLKAAQLAKFALYVEWPEGAFAAPEAPLQLCVAGEDRYGAFLDQVVQGQRIGGRPVALRRLAVVPTPSGCHVLYVGDPARASQALEAVRGQPVLTVTDPRSGATGMIHFVVSDDRVRFEIDDEAAAKSGLAISSKLLALALNVRPRRKEAS